MSKWDLPSKEKISGARCGVGSLPGKRSEQGVAMLPEERLHNAGTLISFCPPSLSRHDIDSVFLVVFSSMMLTILRRDLEFAFAAKNGPASLEGTSFWLKGWGWIAPWKEERAGCRPYTRREAAPSRYGSPSISLPRILTQLPSFPLPQTIF